MSKVSRAQCANCTCSPGLLSRRNKRTSWFAKQINLQRTSSGSSSPKRGRNRRESNFTFDASTVCSDPVKEINTSLRLEKLRLEMKKYDLGVYIIPSEDEHQSEYVSLSDQRRAFISGFSGSAGVAIVTRDIMCMNEKPEGLSALSTDGRYFNQAANELDFNWSLLKQGSKTDLSWQEWSVKQAIQMSLDSGETVKIGIDPKLITLKLEDSITNVIHDKLSLKQNSKARVDFVPINENLIDKIWSHFEEVPAKPSASIKPLDVKYSGESIPKKIEKLQAVMKQLDSTTIVVSALDDIAWLLNLRGSDIDYNPVFYSYLIIQDDKILFYVDSSRFDSTVHDSLRGVNVEIKPYNEFWRDLINISSDHRYKEEHILVSENSSWEIARSLSHKYKRVRSPIEELKAVKNQTEIKGAVSAHLKDGRALCKFFAWLEDQIVNESELIDEYQADEKLTAFRREEENFVGLSFETISSTGANAAVIHYAPKKNDCSVIDPNKIYLNDSGSQFLEGTTDTTRTIHFNTPRQKEIDNYTLVLKGSISLANLKFPEGTTGAMIDAIARQHLWSYGLDYRHGTGHGIGSFLNVHEGPVGIGFRPYCSLAALKEGNLLSNEPGYYEDGEYGIRIENVMYVKDSGLKFGDKKFLQFETITRVPFCRKLINVKMLSDEEKAWINSYHRTIWEELHLSLGKNTRAYNWLKRETYAL